MGQSVSIRDQPLQSPPALGLRRDGVARPEVRRVELKARSELVQQIWISLGCGEHAFAQHDLPTTNSGASEEENHSSKPLQDGYGRADGTPKRKVGAVLPTDDSDRGARDEAQ